MPEIVVVEEGAPAREAAPGTLVAPLLAAAVGLLMLGAVSAAAQADAGVRAAVAAAGAAWIPNAESLGPFAGLETVLLAAWLGAWLLLHLALRRREVDVRASMGAMVALLVVATLLVWPPVWVALGA